MASEHGQAIPVLYAIGTHYEVGYQVGRVFAERIKRYIFEFEDMHTKFLPFYNTELGQEICGAFLKVAKDVFPQYVEEMQGISDGSGVPFDQVLLMHLRVELQTYLECKIVTECSTVFVNDTNNCLLAHNEDTSLAVLDNGYILIATINETKPRGKHQISHEKFLSFCYPGIIPGNCFSCNSSGLVLSVNALYAGGKMRMNSKTPRQFINRATLSAKDPAQLTDILADRGNGIASGCSVNMAFLPNWRDRIMANFELCPQPNIDESLIDKVDITLANTTLSSATGHYVHFNMYQHISVHELEGRTTSSEHRKARADALPPPTNLESALNILGDDADSLYPIFRTPRPTDPGCTVATGVLDLINRKVLIYTGNPKINNRPLIDLPWPWEIQA